MAVWSQVIPCRTGRATELISFCMRVTPWLAMETCNAAGLQLSERAVLLLPLGDTIAPNKKFVRYVSV